eukprot:Skav220979  [mRNA]  locus=scaffold1541:29091:40106:+ [translate_table: standard]
MEDSSPVAVLVRTEGAPATVPPLIAFSQVNSSVSVGRAENNQIPLNDKKISKNHALLQLRACKRKGAQDGEVMRRVFIKDSSTFGTFVNGKALKKGEWSILQEGDAIGLRNPHGNPSNGEYRVAYQDAQSLVKGAVLRGEQPVQAVPASGAGDCVDKAKKLIEEAIDKAKEKTGQVNPNACTLKVPHELIGMLIGRGGETIKDLKKESGARIDISKEPDEEGSSDRLVNITGPPECVEYAKKMVEEMLGKSREGLKVKTEEDENGGSTAELRTAGGRVIKVPLESIGVLIGRGGETISKIQKESHARIEINRDDKDSRERSVTITGSGDAIEKAIRAIDDVLDSAERAGRGKGRRRDEEEGALVPVDRKPSPVKDGWVAEKVYIDEVEMPYRPNYVPEHEDGLPTDLEIFVKGLPKACAERDLWEHLYRLGATDVKEILLLRRQKQSKGMAYVVFNRHEHAVLAKNKLQGVPASAIPCGEGPPEQQLLQVRFSESERCINGRSNVYGADMPILLMGPRGRAMVEVKEASGLRKVTLTGRNMKTFGQVDEDPRVHLVVYYEPDETDNVFKALEHWGRQLGEIHREIVERSKGKGKGKGWPWMPPPPFFDGRPPPWPPVPGRPPGPAAPYAPMPHMHPMMHPPPEPLVEAPVLLTRRKLEDGELSDEKVIEATSLRGRELRWQPWPEVSKFNGEWKVVPLRWGLRGELFVLLRHRQSGETKVCAAEVQNSLEKWPVLHTNSASASAKYKSFTFNEHLFVISIDRKSGTLKVFHVPDPGSAWNVAFETTLPEDPQERPDFPLSRSAKLIPCVVAVEPNASDRNATVWRISDPGKAWTPCGEAPVLPQKVRLLMVYTKARAPGPGGFEACLFAVADGELKVFQVPSDLQQPWVLISTVPFAGDTRLSCIYVPGKPEPLLMAGSPTEKMQKLCHLNLMEWRLAKQDDRQPPPKAPVVEEKFSRPMSSLWPEERKDGDSNAFVALPVDCTADLAVSRHHWVTTPILPPGADFHPPAPRPPFDFRPGPPPGFEARPRPPFEYAPPGPGPPPSRPPFEAVNPGPPPFGPPPGNLNGKAEEQPERHRRRRHRHRRDRGEEGEGEGRKRRRAEKAERERERRAEQKLMDIWGASCLGGKGDYQKALPKSHEWGRAAASFFATMKLDFGFQADSVCNQFEHLISLWRSHAAIVTDRAIQDAYENRWRWSSGSWSDATEPVRMDVNGNKESFNEDNWEVAARLPEATLSHRSGGLFCGHLIKFDMTDIFVEGAPERPCNLLVRPEVRGQTQMSLRWLRTIAPGDSIVERASTLWVLRIASLLFGNSAGPFRTDGLKADAADAVIISAGKNLNLTRWTRFNQGKFRMAEYMRCFMGALDHEVSIYDSLDGRNLVPYQCVVLRSQWMPLRASFFEAFHLQKAAYRRANGGTTAPGIIEDARPHMLRGDRADGAVVSSDSDQLLADSSKFVVRNTFLELDDVPDPCPMKRSKSDSGDLSTTFSV